MWELAIYLLYLMVTKLSFFEILGHLNVPCLLRAQPSDHTLWYNALFDGGGWPLRQIKVMLRFFYLQLFLNGIRTS